MKFYFCETCGKRLTEKDIAEGAAKNKKLKGVFCQECAIGVTTMETIPLSDSQAKNLLESEESKPGAKRSLPSSRRTPGAGNRPISRRKSAPNPESERAAARSQTPLLIAVGVGVVVAMGLLLFVLTSGDGGPPQTAKVNQKGSEQAQKTEAEPKAERPELPVRKQQEQPPVTTPPVTGPPPETESPLQLGPEPKVDTPPTPEKKAALPKPPSDLAAEALPDGKVRLQWKLPDPAPAKCCVERAGQPSDKPDALQWKAIGEVAGTTTQFVDDNVSAGAKYAYRIRVGEQNQAQYSETTEIALKDPEAEERIAYAAFHSNFLSALATEDLAGAGELIKKAETNLKTDAVVALLKSDRNALTWTRDAGQALLKGVEMLAAVDSMVLRLKGGSKMSVGRKESFKVKARKDDKLILASKGVEMPLDLERLAVSSRARLTDMGLGSGADGLLRKAFMRILAAGKQSKAALDESRRAMEKAEKAGIEKSDLACLARAYAWASRSVLASQWVSVKEKAEARKWREALAATKGFEKTFSDNQHFPPYREKVNRLAEEAQHQIERLEGMLFDFKTEKNITRFRELFKMTGQHNAALSFADGRMSVKSTATGQHPSISLTASQLTYGERWSFRGRVRLHPPFTEEGGRVRCPSGPFGRVFSLIFQKKGSTSPRGRSHFNVSATHLYLGILQCGFHCRGSSHTDRNLRGIGFFAGMAKPGTRKVGILGKKEIRGPWQKDGWYEVELRVDEDRAQVKLNGQDVPVSALPSTAVDLMKDSTIRLKLVPGVKGGIIEVSELHFRPNLPRPAENREK